jgi:hypothetical protein
MPKTEQTKRAYVEATGKAPTGEAFEKWLQKKTGGDFSDSNMAKVFGGGGDPSPLKKGEKTLPQKAFEKEQPRIEDRGAGLSDKEYGLKYGEKKSDDRMEYMKKLHPKVKGVEVGPSEASKKVSRYNIGVGTKNAELAKKRFDADRKARKESDIESY